MDIKDDVKYYKLIWLDGSYEIISGSSISDAANKAGYALGAIQALDHYDEIYPDVLISITYKGDDVGVASRCSFYENLDDVNYDKIWHKLYDLRNSNDLNPNILKNIYIDDIFINKLYYQKSLIATSSKMLSYTIYPNNSTLTNIISIIITPISKEATGMVMGMILDKTFKKCIDNGCITSGVINIGDSDYSKLLTSVIDEDLHTFGNKEVMVAYSTTEYCYIYNYYYIIDQNDLKQKVLKIYVNDKLVPHIIGKGGKNINKLKENIYQKGYDKVKRIEVVPVVE